MKNSAASEVPMLTAIAFSKSGLARPPPSTAGSPRATSPAIGRTRSKSKSSAATLASSARPALFKAAAAPKAVRLQLFLTRLREEKIDEGIGGRGIFRARNDGDQIFGALLKLGRERDRVDLRSESASASVR